MAPAVAGSIPVGHPIAPAVRAPSAGARTWPVARLRGSVETGLRPLRSRGARRAPSSRQQGTAAVTAAARRSSCDRPVAPSRGPARLRAPFASEHELGLGVLQRLTARRRQVRRGDRDRRGVPGVVNPVVAGAGVFCTTTSANAGERTTNPNPIPRKDPRTRIRPEQRETRAACRAARVRRLRPRNRDGFRWVWRDQLGSGFGVVGPLGGSSGFAIFSAGGRSPVSASRNVTIDFASASEISLPS